jgi:hypothetical protein
MCLLWLTRLLQMHAVCCKRTMPAAYMMAVLPACRCSVTNPAWTLSPPPVPACRMRARCSHRRASCHAAWPSGSCCQRHWHRRWPAPSLLLWPQWMLWQAICTSMQLRGRAEQHRQQQGTGEAWWLAGTCVICLTCHGRGCRVWLHQLWQTLWWLTPL